MAPPPVTVLMTVLNGATYLESALRSLMTQTLKDIEIFVVDDGSTDETPEILSRFAAEDPRIRIETLPQNMGIGRADNHALALIESPYVARLDSDDLAIPMRLEAQLAYLEAHPEVVLVGSSIGQIDAEGRLFRTSIRPRDDFACRWLGRFSNPLNHPATMFRRLGPDGEPLFYPLELKWVFDYDFLAMALDHGRVVSLPQVLTHYRVHKGSITGQKYHNQLEQMATVARRVQAAQLSEELCRTLDPFNRACLDCQPVEPAEILASFRPMLARDLENHPERRAWLWRQGGQLLLTALQRSGLSGKRALSTLVRFAPGFVPALGLRYLETRQALPRSLRSDPFF